MRGKKKKQNDCHKCKECLVLLESPSSCHGAPSIVEGSSEGIGLVTWTPLWVQTSANVMEPRSSLGKRASSTRRLDVHVNSRHAIPVEKVRPGVTM